MSVASHLKIDLADYDHRIRTFIPWYGEMLDAAAGAFARVNGRTPAVLDLGIGTGALAERCLRTRPRARLIGVDGDPEILAAAERRLRRVTVGVTLIEGDFERVELPRADAAVASLSLHHVATRARKRCLFRRLHAALRRGGLVVNADCMPAADVAAARAQLGGWRDHLLASYSRRETDRYFRAWARDDVYLPLPTELALFAEAGFAAEIIWRRGAFAVIAAMKR